jgi:hypothetical protein
MLRIRILQTQIHKLNKSIKGGNTDTGKADRDDEEEEFECDTFFPLNLSHGQTTEIQPSEAGDEGRGGFKPVPSSTLETWLQTPSPTTADGNKPNPDTIPIPLPQGESSWLIDSKASVKLRAVGWERL